MVEIYRIINESHPIISYIWIKFHTR